MKSQKLKPSIKLTKLRKFQQSLKDRLTATHIEASSWMEKKGLNLDKIKIASKGAVTATTFAGALISGKPIDTQVMDRIKLIDFGKNNQILAQVSMEEHQEILNKMKGFVAQPPGHLGQEDELYLEQQLSDMLGFEVTAELDSHRLNHSIGIMGGEQHLRRFPTDTLSQHDACIQAGIAPSRGAFGWFTQEGELTQKAIEREKYYFAVQTLYLPDWSENYQDLRPWYKYRKMVVINPADGFAVVGVVGDAGPAEWVGKQFGGSPEVIREARIWSKDAKGRVIILFINDPEDKVSLGVIDLNKPKKELLASIEKQSNKKI